MSCEPSQQTKYKTEGDKQNATTLKNILSTGLNVLMKV